MEAKIVSLTPTGDVDIEFISGSGLSPSGVIDRDRNFYTKKSIYSDGIPTGRFLRKPRRHDGV